MKPGLVQCSRTKSLQEKSGVFPLDLSGEESGGSGDGEFGRKWNI